MREQMERTADEILKESSITDYSEEEVIGHSIDLMTDTADSIKYAFNEALGRNPTKDELIRILDESFRIIGLDYKMI